MPDKDARKDRTLSSLLPRTTTLIEVDSANVWIKALVLQIGTAELEIIDAPLLEHIDDLDTNLRSCLRRRRRSQRTVVSVSSVVNIAGEDIELFELYVSVPARVNRSYVRNIAEHTLKQVENTESVSDLIHRVRVELNT